MTSTRKTRRLLAAGVAVTLAMATAACSAPEPTTDPNAEIELQVLGAEDISAFQPAIDAFQAENPNITIIYNSVPFAQFSSTIQARMSARDSGLDVYMVDEPRVPFLGSSEFVVPYPGDADALAETLNKNDLEAVTWNDQIWGLPMWTSSQVLYYNKALLAQAGIPDPSSAPEDRLTWEELIDQATAAQAAGAQYGFSFQQVDRYYQLQTLPETLGGGPGLTGDDLLTPDLENDGWEQAMEWYASTFADGVSPRGIDVGQIPPLFQDGKLAFMVGTPVYVSSFAAIDTLDWGVAPMPTFEGTDAATPTDGWALGVSPYSEKQEAAWKFIEFLTLDPEGSAASIQGKPFPSANKATQEDYLAQLPELAGGHAPEISNLLTYELENTAIHRPRTTGYVVFEEVMNKAFADIRNGADPVERLAQAQRDLGAVFGRLPGN
ncbi:MAG: sugar transporter substrate-binding protein [Rhodoglobus sp.]|nr:sugar transporter substrate-binding protein [Rhodoglobus sp.]